MTSCVQHSVLQVLGRSWRPVYSILLPHFILVEFHIGISFVSMGEAPPALSLPPSLLLSLSFSVSLSLYPSLSVYLSLSLSVALSLSDRNGKDCWVSRIRMAAAGGW